MYSHTTIQDLVNWTGGSLSYCDNLNARVPSISTDTRTLKKSEVFIAVRGENFDGHKFLQKAHECGASLVITEEDGPKNVPQLKVKDTLHAFAAIAKNLRRKFKGPIVAITGSAGKSSTKEMVATLLGENTLKSPASFNNLLGVSKTLCLIEDTTQKIVLEMGMNNFFEIKEMCNYFEPNFGIITNIGDAHIGKLGGQEGIYLAKKELFDFLAQNPLTQGIALNLDDSLVIKAYKESFGQYKNTVTYSTHTSANADVTLVNQEIDSETAFLNLSLKIFKEWVDVSLPIFGLHHSSNLLAAISMASLFGVSVGETKERLGNILPAKHRGVITSLKDGKVLIDESYNSNPSALASSLYSLSQVPWKARVVLVIGQMNELGEFSEEKHKEAGEKILKYFADKKDLLLITVGKECKVLTEVVKKSKPHWEQYSYTNVTELVPAFEQLLKPKDLIYLKGSNGIRLFDLVKS